LVARAGILSGFESASAEDNLRGIRCPIEPQQ
jgi:hypothetical protein